MTEEKNIQQEAVEAAAQEPAINEVDGQPIYHAEEEEGNGNE